MNLRISQGQATRSTFTFSRVTHFISPSCASVLFLQPAERLLHALQMRMLTAAHSFVFGALQGPLISLPRLQDGTLLGDRNSYRLDNVHRPSEPTARIAPRLTDMQLVMHG